MIELVATTESTVSKEAAPGLLERMIHQVAARLLTFDPHGTLLVEMPSGQRYRFGHSERGGADIPLLKLNDFSVLRRGVMRGKLGFAESYLCGAVEVSDLTALFRFFLRNEEAFAQAGRSWFRVRLPDRWQHRRRHNSRRNSRRNIAAHYDLSNAFFAQWLDPEMVYSSAVFSGKEQTLEQAQAAKLDRIVSLLGVGDGDRVLEIGCGWGGLARRIATGTNASVTGITLSQQQLEYSIEAARQAGLSDRLEFRLQDYRDTSGTFDGIVSIEMIEAVGEAYWPVYFQTLAARLRRGAGAVVQAITIDEAHFDEYRDNADFIQRYIFPGGMLPTVSIMHEQARAAGLRIDHVEHFGKSYAETLRIWRRRFEAAWPRIANMGFDERFRRMWRYYLAYCEAGFEEGTIDVGLYRLKHA